MRRDVVDAARHNACRLMRYSPCATPDERTRHGDEECSYSFLFFAAATIRAINSVA